MTFIALMVACRKDEPDVDFGCTVARIEAPTRDNAILMAEEDNRREKPESEGWYKHTVRIESLEDFLA